MKQTIDWIGERHTISQTCTLIYPSEHPDWDRFVTNHPLSTIYHHSSWLNVLRSTYPRLSLAAFAIMDHDNRIRSALLFSMGRRKAISIAFTPYCTPLAESGEHMDKLLHAATGLVDANMASYYELRALGSDHFTGSTLRRAEYRDKNHILRLTGGIEKVQKTFHPSQVNKAIRKAVRTGVTVRTGSSDADVRLFFQMYARTRKHLGLPIPPFTLFNNMRRYMQPHQLTIFIAEYNERPVGTLLTLSYKDTISLEYLGYDKRDVHLRANHLLYFTAIQRACEEGYACVDFRKTPADNEGLLDFKRRWGTEETDISYYYYPSNRKNASVGNGTLKRKAFSLINRPLPLMLAIHLGEVVYRHMG